MSRWKERRIWKQAIVEKVKQDKFLLKQQKQQISTLPESEQKIQLDQLKIEQKQQRLHKKASIKQLVGKEKRKAKKENKMYFKIKRRPLRFTIWSIIALIVIYTIISVGPTATHLLDALTSKHITAVTNTPEGIAAREYGATIAKQLSDEGIVLLKNEDQHLPLQQKKINVFGISALDIRYGGSGSGAADYSRAINLFDSLQQAGIEYNTELYEFYLKQSEEAKGSSGNDIGIIQVVKSLLMTEIIDEPNISHLTDNVLQQAKSFSDNALIVISADGAEASDMSVEQLRLTENKRKLIEKVSENFSHVTIVVNAGNAMELGFVEEIESIKSVLWIGTPGPYGAKSLADILAGTINPSGRIIDTYVYNNKSSPASENFGNYQYDNLDKAFINYEEGIYVGYRFYETYYQDDEAGYKKTVQYPFGYGLSYTEFNWEVVGENFNEEQIELQVKVTNRGDKAGKDVVQLYFSAPYYDGGLEKSAIELGAFAKTKLLQPNESEIITLAYQTRDMSSYDMNREEAYVLEQGVYHIKLARNVHDIVDERLFQLDQTIVYREDAVTGKAYENKFEEANGGLTYLSRSDFDATYPTDSDNNYSAPDNVLEVFTTKLTESSLNMPAFNQDHGLKLQDLQGLTYDDEKWELFLDQFTVKELKKLVTQGAYHTIAIERLGVPKTLLMDGPAGFSYFFGKVEAASYPTVSLIAATWNEQLANQMGHAVGQEAKAYGIQGWYAPGMNIHRTAQGGRNFEYFSEDPLLTGKMAAAMSQGAQDEGIIVFMKHFALNDQETNARTGILVWANEQAIREIYLKPFEITVKEGQVTGAMSSFSHIGPTWAGGNSKLLNDILREEWGFKGVVSSDAVFGFMQAPQAITNGNDLMLDIMSAPTNEKRLDQAYKETPIIIAHGLRQSAHNLLYAILQTYLYQ